MLGSATKAKRVTRANQNAGGTTTSTLILFLIGVGLIITVLFQVHSAVPFCPHEHISKQSVPSERVATPTSLPTTGPAPNCTECQTMKVCTEKCRYKAVMDLCFPGFENTYRLPAPKCVGPINGFTEPDPYWDADGVGVLAMNNNTDANNQNIKQLATSQADVVAKYWNVPSCSQHMMAQEPPMSFPDEFEFKVKTLANRRPKTYLEWGTGKSIAFYPPLAKDIYVVDNYEEWCKKIEQQPVALCLRESGRMQFSCNTPTDVSGKPMQQLAEGRLSDQYTPNDIRHACLQHLSVLEKFKKPLNFGELDAALIDGRFRVPVSIYILPYLHNTSVVLIHDFPLRMNYKNVLLYYNLIGRSRTAVALQRKPINELPITWREDHRAQCVYMN